MTDDISKVIEAVAKLTSLAGSTVPQVQKMVQIPIQTKIQSVTTAQQVLNNLIQSQQDEYTVNQQLALLSVEIDTSYQRDKYTDKLKDMVKDLKDNLKKRQGKTANALKKGAKSKLEKVIVQLDAMSERLEKINEKIDKLAEEKAKLDKKVESILQSTSGEQDKLKEEQQKNNENSNAENGEKTKLTKAQKLEKKKKELEEKKRNLLAKRTELKCKMARLISLNSDNDKLCELANSTQNQVFSSISKLPVNAIKTVDALIDFILFLISGVLSPQDDDMDVVKMIKDMISMINPIAMKMMTLPVPKVPGLSEMPQILQILETVAKPMTATDDEIKEKIKEVPNLPTQFIPIILNTLSTMAAVGGSLFMALFNLILQMLKSIVDLFKQIADVLGIPKIPFPLTLIPQLIEMIPDLTQLIIMAPIQIPTIITKIILDKVREIQYLQIPDTIELNNILPEDFELCEKHMKEQMEEDILQKQKEQEQAEKKHQEEEAFQASIMNGSADGVL